MKTEKKIFVAIIALLTVVCYSCSSDDNAPTLSMPSNTTTSLKLSLDSLNESILAELGEGVTRVACKCTHNCGPNCQCGCQQGGGHEETDTTTVVVLKDLAGAIVTGGAGAQLGAAVGSVLPLIGNVLGGVLGSVVGAAVGAAASSLAAYNNIELTAIELCDTLSLIHYDNVIGAMNKVLYINGVPDYNYSPVFLNSMSDEVVDLFEISALHNYMLDELRDTLTFKKQYKYISDLPATWVDSLGLQYNNSLQNIPNAYNAGNVSIGPQSNLETVFYSFADLFLENATSERNVDIMIANYLDFVDDSVDLSKDEKNILTVGFGVCWHSYKYWTQPFSTL